MSISVSATRTVFSMLEATGCKVSTVFIDGKEAIERIVPSFSVAHAISKKTPLGVFLLWRTPAPCGAEK